MEVFMKTKLALVCLSFIASNSYTMIYLEDEEDGLASIDQEITQAWEETYNQPEKVVRNKTRPQHPYPTEQLEEEETQELI